MTDRITKTLLCVISLAAFTLVAGDAAAETVYAKSSTPVYDRPGEMARIVTRASRGDAMKVLRKPKGDTRWYKVRVSGRTGWVPRSKVTTKGSSKSAQSSRKRRRRAFVEGRGRKRGGLDKDAPEDRIGGDATSGDVEDDGDVIVDDDEEEEPRARKKKRRKAKKKKRRKARRQARVEDDDEDEGDEADEEEEEDFEEDEPEEVEEDTPDNAMIVRKAAAVYHKPKRSSGEMVELDKGDTVFVVKESKSGRWLKVNTEDGQTGWIRANKVEAASYVRPKYAIDLAAHLGFTLFSQNFTSDGPDNNQYAAYQISNVGVLSIRVGGTFDYDYSDSWLFGGDFFYRYGYGSPGIRYTMDAVSTDIGFATHNVDIGARAGYKIGRSSGMVLYGRFGYSYMNMSINNYQDMEANPLLLPNENVGAFALGAQFVAPKVYDKLAIGLGFDYFLPAQREQTENLEDGGTADVSSYRAMLSVAYHWKPKWDILGFINYRSFNTKFSGAATRPTDATQAERDDTNTSFMIGILRPLF